ncbi:hypothetical protein ABB37_03733 [Leptomonas pyrrhocoris]|uniref:CRAL-TRIO domain-containing protein n=1 Tax=Leptomonas pyrrhocoris TaxID=157538 RepID=A0A0N0VFJ5_LEPPY|nr:hypothetical protein ABB37_03733 [Leptomonas pyrrhocoris]KPA81344.1 hypothetical protein ABB37_03733 [Leptomonas pyrrhocoris]|eukprot:XP_015659783.1 hypothetical protein ABB37_03733 [Leptomonas pyrrhocoris]
MFELDNTPLPVAKPPSAAGGWEAQYEKDFAAQKNSGPVVFTEEQRQKNKELLSRIFDLLPFADAYKASDCDLIYRFLIGKHWNVNLADKGMREYMELRAKEHLDGLLAEQLHPTIGAVLSPCYSDGTPCPMYGLDKDGLPILWLSPDAAKLIEAMKLFTGEQLLRGQMRTIELGRFACRARGVDRCTYVIDLGGITMSSVNKATLGFLKGVTHILQVAYPEIMRRLLIFNTGWTVSAAWKVLRPFVDVRVQDKIKFESRAPTLTALQPYMDADQVHPAFGGTGKENVLEPLVEAEVRRVRRLAEGGAPSESASLIRGPSTAVYDNGSLFDVDPLALHSFYCPTPGTEPQTPNSSQQNPPSGGISPTPDRMVIGVPRAVSAWMANMDEEGARKDALDISLSVASSASEYAVGRSAADGSAPETPPLKPDTASAPIPTTPPTPPSPSQQGGRVATASTPARAAAAGLPPLPSAGEPLQLTDSGRSGTAQKEDRLIVAMSLTYGADGSITGYNGPECVGQFRNGRLYASPKERDVDSAGSPSSSPSMASPGSLPGHDNTQSDRGSGQQPQRQQQFLSAIRSSPATGELLYEAGHPIHNFYIVCDGQRNARYLLRRSRLRTRLTVFNVVGGAPVRTEKNSRHYVEGERAKLGVVVAHTDPTANSRGDWMLYGEDVTQHSPGHHIRNFFSKTRRSSAPATDGSGGSGAEKEKERDAGWATSMFAAMRSSTSGTATSPSKRKAKSATHRGADVAPAADNSENSGNGSGAQLLAENKGQTVYFYHLLTKNPLSDLFALAVAITLSWSGELEGLKVKSTSKTKRYASDDEDLME